ncbi:MAG: beta-N-acetylhexosaminidase [Clostridia bacterium]|nr:beta-N-acetylhexosaminidase [Clostridia bacterium]
MINIIPKPQKATELKEKIFFSTKTALCGEFLETVKLFEGLIPAAVEAESNTLTFIKDESIAVDGYKLTYKDGNIEIYCSDKGGALYGFMTLVQLAAGKEQFDAVEVCDKPKYSWRSFMLDCSRHFWSVEHIKTTLDILASLKMNVFHWHLCDDQGWRVEIKKYPILTEKGTVRRGTCQSPLQSINKEKTYDDGIYGEGLYYTQDDVREIVAYAAERNITVIPEIDVPGHASAIIACMPELSCTGEPREVEPRFGILDNILCCAKPQVYEVLKDIFDELCELFPAPYFHIGGDEVVPTAWENCPDCQALMKKEGLADHVALHGYFNNILIAHLGTRGKRAIGWNDMLNPDLDKTAIGQFWTGDRKLEEALDWVNNQGGDVILSSQIYMYGDYPYSRLSLSTTYNFNAEYLGIERMEGVLGYEIPLWTEYVKCPEKFGFQIHARLLAVAESCWTQPLLKNYENFEYRLENMRPYLESRGMVIPPRKIYSGYTFDGAENMTFYNRREDGFRKHWYGAVDYEFNMFKDLTK